MKPGMPICCKSEVFFVYETGYANLPQGTAKWWSVLLVDDTG